MMRVRHVWCGWVVLLGFVYEAATAGAAESSVDTVVVCPAAFAEAMADWRQYRRSQGHRFLFVEPSPGAQATLSTIRQSAGEAVRYVVLIGDAPVEGAAATSTETPTVFSAAVINRRWGSEATIAGDSAFGDLDGDGSPEAAVGRIPCDSPAQLRRYLDRVLARERRGSANCRHRLTLVASPGRFSPMLDRVIETTAVRVLNQLTPPACHLHVTFADWRSHYCPYPPEMPRAIGEGLGAPALAWVYLGHGSRDRLDVLQTPLGHARLLDGELARSLDAERFPPVAVIIACETGAFDGNDDCLAEDLLAAPGGPLAVVASSRVSMPYGNSVLGLELLRGMFDGKPKTLGTLVANAKSRLVAPAGDEGLRQAIEMIAAGFTPTQADRKRELDEHARMYNLLGDPLLRTQCPQPLELKAERRADGSSGWRVMGQSPVAGRCRLCIAKRRGTEVSRARKEFRLGKQAEAEFGDAYRAVNQHVLIETIVQVPSGRFEAKIDSPAKLAAETLLIAEVVGEAGFAAGSVKLPQPSGDGHDDRHPSPRP